MTERFAIIVPVLDDWESFATLVAHLADTFATIDATAEVIAVDDGSSEPFDARSLAGLIGGGLSAITIVRLATNLGHQRAIAAGLATVARRTDLNAVIVMDSDGEDRPEDIPALFAAHQQDPARAILAQRAKRSERGVFRIGYFFYKRLFRLLTGQTIDFGNFSLLPFAVVRRLVHMPELWNNLPAALIRSRVRYTPVPLARGVRYAGQSRMNLSSLVVHGMSAMSVYTDVIFVRIIFLAGLVSGLTALAMLGVVGIRIFTDLGIPGWASTMFGNLMVILMQTLVMVIATSLVLLSGRSQRPIIPLLDAPAFIADDGTGDAACSVSGPGARDTSI